MGLNIMGVLKELKSSLVRSMESKPDVFSSKFVIDGGNTSVTLVHTEGSGVVTFKVDQENTLDKVVAVEVDACSGISALIATSLEMRFGSATKGHYPVKVNDGGRIEVGQDEWRVTFTVISGEDRAVARFTPIEFESFLTMLRFYSL